MKDKLRRYIGQVIAKDFDAYCMDYAAHQPRIVAEVLNTREDRHDDAKTKMLKKGIIGVSWNFSIKI